MAEIRIFNRFIEVTRLDFPPAYRFLRGGRATPWPWLSFRIGRVDVTISRIRPRKAASVASADTTDDDGGS